MEPHYTRFTDMLAGHTGDPVLFEPFIPIYLTEQLIWRRGKHLWQEIPAYLSTLLSLRERTSGDVVPADMRLFPGKEEKMAAYMTEMAPENIRFVAICDTVEEYHAAGKSDGVCAVGIYDWQNWLSGAPESPKPVIAMDGDCDAAANAGLAGWFCPENCELYWQRYHDRLAILGGLGADWLRTAQPMTIYTRCEELFTMTMGKRFAIGSGGILTDEDYLSLISLLGAYKRIR